MSPGLLPAAIWHRFWSLNPDLELCELLRVLWELLCELLWELCEQFGLLWKLLELIWELLWRP